jgi:hypothetical protein
MRINVLLRDPGVLYSKPVIYDVPIIYIFLMLYAGLQEHHSNTILPLNMLH